MNVFLAGILLLDVAYFSSPHAQCEDQVGESNMMGQWQGANENNSDHGVLGSKDGVYAITDKWVLARKFAYAGDAPAVQFIAGISDEPDGNGTACLLQGMTESNYKLEKYDGDKDLLMELPKDKKWEELKYLSVWDRELKANLASIKLPPANPSFKIPQQMDLGEFTEPNPDHGTKGKVKVLSSQAFELSDFDFDPKTSTQAYFMVGTTEKPDDTGGEMLPDEELADPPKAIAKPYKAQTIVIKLQQDKSYCMYKWFGVYDAEKKASLGHVMLKPGAVPPEVGQNGKGWGPTSTTVGAGGGGPAPEDVTPSEDPAPSEDTEAPPPSPPTPPTRGRSTPSIPSDLFTTTKFAVKTEYSCGIILATTIFLLYYYH